MTLYRTRQNYALFLSAVEGGEWTQYKSFCLTFMQTSIGEPVGLHWACSGTSKTPKGSNQILRGLCHLLCLCTHFKSSNKTKAIYIIKRISTVKITIHCFREAASIGSIKKIGSFLTPGWSPLNPNEEGSRATVEVEAGKGDLSNRRQCTQAERTGRD